MDASDAPSDLITGGHASAHIDYGPRGPHIARAPKSESEAQS
jgi:hypothetical protein